MTPTPVGDRRESTREAERLLIFLAGSNGAGKTTFFTQILAPLGLHFVNAGLLARELDPYAFVARYQNGRMVGTSGRAHAWTRRLPEISKN